MQNGVVLTLLLILAVLGVRCTTGLSYKPVVKIGLVAPFEGFYRPLGYRVLPAVRLAVRQRNEAGGLAGHPVEVVVLNDSADPTKAREQAHEMVLDPDVMGVIGHFSDATTLAAEREYQRAGLAAITPAATADRIKRWSPSHVFRLSAANSQQGKAAADWAVAELGAHRLAVIRHQDDLADAFVARAETLGASVVVDQEACGQDISLNSRWLSAELIFFAGGFVEGAALIGRVRAKGVKVPILGPRYWDDPKLARLAEGPAGDVFHLRLIPDLNKTTEGQRFIGDYAALVRDSPSAEAALGYDAAQILLAAIEGTIQSGDRLSRSAVVTRLRHSGPFPGVTGQIAFDDAGNRSEAPVRVVPMEGEATALPNSFHASSVLSSAGGFDYPIGP